MNQKEIKVNEFARKQGYTGAKYAGKWGEYEVYEPYMSKNQLSYTGLPLVILVNSRGKIRMSTPDEAIEITTI